jgi:hypothetical protein
VSRCAVAHSRVRFGLGVRLGKYGVQWSLRGVMDSIGSPHGVHMESMGECKVLPVDHHNFHIEIGRPVAQPAA